ncbi:MAG: hypothetical protein BroJett024_41590 [Alphaproteobacteria bacterium]|nr:MAG: hypothetical protein BroJett024_41590 [Alphaproteobacteria bacterium]
MTTDAHPLRGTVLRALQVAPRNSAELARAIAQHSPRNIGFAVEALAAEGLIALKWSRWRLTRRGREALPSLSALPPMQPYVPPMVVRRPGSDHSHIPSLAGGRLIRRSA